MTGKTGNLRPRRPGARTRAAAGVEVIRAASQGRVKNAGDQPVPQLTLVPSDRAPSEAQPTTPEPTSQPAGTSRNPTASIELEPQISGGWINGRFDLILRGRVAASISIEAIELVVQDTVVGRVEFAGSGRGRTGPSTEWDGDHQHGFQLSLPLMEAEAAGRCSLLLRGLLDAGEIHEERVELLVEPAADPPIRLISGPVRAGVGQEAGIPQVILYVERALINAAGAVLVHGWVLATSRVLTVQAFVHNDRLASARLGGAREDVADHYPAYPNARTSGFVLTGQSQSTDPAPLETVRVQAISVDGYSYEVTVPLEHAPAETIQEPQAGPSPAGPAEPESAAEADPHRKIHYHCDEVWFAPDGTLHVLGWAVCEIGIAGVVIELDGEPLGAAERGHPRPDVGEEFANIPEAQNAGFRYVQRIAGLAEGEHQIAVVLRNAMGDSRTDLRSVHAEKPVVPPQTPASEQEFRFELDSPRVNDGAAVEPVKDRLSVEGWVLARSGVSGIDVFLNDQRFGEAMYGVARPDVGAAFPEWDNALRSGYAFHFPARVLKNGEHVVRLVVRAKNGEAFEQRFDILVNKTDSEDQAISIRRRIGQVETAALSRVLENTGCHPEFHLIVLHGNGAPEAELRATLNSLREQAYHGFRVSVVTPAPDIVGVVASLWESHGPGPAIEVLTGERAAMGIDLSGGSPKLYGVLRSGDLLGCDALLELAAAAAIHQDAELLYADETRISPASQEREPFFKPDFSPDLLLSTNYIGRPWFASAALLGRCGFTLGALLDTGEYDVVLRCTEQARAIHHVPRLLAQRGAASLDDEAAERAALARAAQRRGWTAEVDAGCVPGTYRVRRRQSVTGKVSIIIPTCAAHGHIKNCIRTLREKTAYRNFEIVCIDNIPESEPGWKSWLRENADLIVDIPEAFNWSRFNNQAARACEGEFLLFLNDDTEIVQADWLDAMLEHATRPDVGIVGPLLLYPGGNVQHAGMFLGAGIGRHAFRFAAETEPGYFGLGLTQRNVIAVTGACMLMRRAFFDELDGFEEAHSVINNDLDFCLRTHRAGKLTVYTPHAKLIHHELASRDRLPDVFDTTQFDSRWRTMFASGDPYFSPQLSRHSDDYRPDSEPTQTVFAGHPLFARDEIRRILVVKLDHIGDFITALPVIRRLKAVFPQARITVLAGRAAAAFVAMEPAIDEYLEFEFFHARSQLGEKELTEDDLTGLRARLVPYRFDLAIDLRKHLSTRNILRYTGARYLAGFDYMGQFPFLDIALEWDGDRKLQRKRNHVIDDLLALIEAVNTACLEDRSLMARPPEPMTIEALPDGARELFGRPVVAVHAGAGNITKEWPASYFTALIDMLIERNGVNVLLIGGPDDQARSDEIMQSALYPDRMASIAGQVRLADLPRVLVRCVLYVGNDSGPKHIAAAVGVPTVGVHSGVVDPTEWGPMGPQAVALRRDMTCSPCYLANAEDCPRNLACLRFLDPSHVYRAAALLLARPAGSDKTVRSADRGQTAEPPAKPAANPSNRPAPTAKSAPRGERSPPAKTKRPVGRRSR